MESQSDTTEEIQEDSFQSEVQEDVVVCPNCKMEGPNSPYCNYCGYPLYVENYQAPMTQETEETIDTGKEIVSEPIESEPEPLEETTFETEVSDIDEDIGEKEEIYEEKVEPEQAETFTLFDSARAQAHSLVNRFKGYWRGSQTREIEKEEGIDVGDFPLDEVPSSRLDVSEEIEEEVLSREDIERQEKVVILKSTTKQDPILKDVMEHLIKCVSMELWLVNLLKDDKIDEEQFNVLFDDYVNKTDVFMNCRKDLLDSARDMDSINKAFTEANVKLEELEMKKNIGYISEEEYRAKAPALEWDVRKYKEEISKRNEDIEFLEDLTSIISIEDINNIQETSKNYIKVMNNLEKSSKITSDMTEKIKESLERILSCIDNSVS